MNAVPAALACSCKARVGSGSRLKVSEKKRRNPNQIKDFRQIDILYSQINRISGKELSKQLFYYFRQNFNFASNKRQSFQELN